MEELQKAASLEDAMNDIFVKEGAVVETPTTETPVDTVVTPPVEEKVETPIETHTEEVVTPTEEITNVEIKTVATAPEPVIQEKIVEKPIEFKDENAEKLYKAITEGGEEAERAALNYLNSKYKDYTSMSTLDVLRERIKADKPHWDADDVQAQVEAVYGKENLSKIDISLIDKEDYLDEKDYNKEVKQAENYNKEIDRLTKLRERDAKDARVFLESQKQNIELPSVKREEAVATPQKTQSEIDAEVTAWNSKVESEMQDFSEIKVKVGNEEITYKFTDQEKTEQVDYMKKADLSSLIADLGWIRPDGTDDIKKIAEDVRKLKDFQKIMSSVGTQIKTLAKKEIIAKDIKNIDLNDKTTTVDTPKQSFGDYALSV